MRILIAIALAALFIAPAVAEPQVAPAGGEAFMNLVERVKAIIMTPKTEWLAIEGEPGDPQFLFSNYVAILAAIPVALPAAFTLSAALGVSASECSKLTGSSSR